MSNFSATLVFAKSFSKLHGFTQVRVIKTDEYLNPQKLPRTLVADGRNSTYSVARVQELKSSSYSETYTVEELAGMKLFLISERGTVMEILNFGFEDKPALLEAGQLVRVTASAEKLRGFSTDSEVKTGEVYRIKRLSPMSPATYVLTTVGGTSIERSHVKVEWVEKFEI